MYLIIQSLTICSSPGCRALSEILKYYDNENLAEEYRKHFTLEVFPKAKEFLEEFGDIVIKKKGHPYYIFNLGGVYKDEYNPYFSEEFSILLNQKVLVIGDCSGGMNIIYITESGEIYDSCGFVFMINRELFLGRNL